MGKGFMAIEVSHELVDPKVLVNSSKYGPLLFDHVVPVSLMGTVASDGQNKR